MFNFNINMYAIYDDLDMEASFNLGNEELVDAFFNSIAYHLENNKWGSVYPKIMNEFYKGKLEQKNINSAIVEIKDIKKKLSKINASKMITNIEIDIAEKLFYEKMNISLDDIFINSKNEKMTDIMLKVLESIKNEQLPLYIGEYYRKELYEPEIYDIVEKTQKKLKRNNIIKYLIYLLIIIIIKLITTEPQFIEFLKKFIFSMVIAELIIFDHKRKIESKEKE